jgi:hypothetical protein
VPTDIIREFLATANIQPQESRFTVLYRDALVNFYAGNYEKRGIFFRNCREFLLITKT